MKVGSVEVSGVHEQVLVLPRGEKKLVFRARGITSFEEFNKLCPMPEAPTMMKRIDNKMQRVPNNNDPIYKAKLVDWATKRANWMVLKTLEPSNIEWDTVKMDQPDTWGNYINELEKNFADSEAIKIMELAQEVNGIDERKLKEARESFFLEQAQAENEQSHPTGDQPNILSGGPASDPTTRIQDLKKQAALKT